MQTKKNLGSSDLRVSHCRIEEGKVSVTKYLPSSRLVEMSMRNIGRHIFRWNNKNSFNRAIKILSNNQLLILGCNLPQKCSALKTHKHRIITMIKMRR